MRARAKDAGFLGASAHGQLVAKIANRGEAHAGDAQVLTERGDVLHIEFVESDDAIDGLQAGHVADRVEQMLLGEILGHEEYVIERFARPVSVAEFFDGEEEHAAAQSFAGAQKFLALFVRADTENGERAIVGHAASSVSRKISRIILWTPPRDTRIAKMGQRAGPKRLR